MKAILAFALLALTVSASDPVQTFTDFNQNLGLDSQQVQDGNTCLENGVFVAINQAFQLYGVLQTQGPAQFLNQASQLYGQIVSNLETECEYYINDLANLYVSQSNGNSVQEIFDQYGPEIIQQVAQLVLAIQENQNGQQIDTAAQAADIVKILIGAEEPTVLPVPQFNWTLVEANNATEEVQLNQYFEAYFNALGLGQEANVTAAVQCIGKLNAFAQAGQTLGGQLSTADFNGALDAIKAYSDNLIETIRGCEGGIQDYALILVPIYNAYQASPAGFALNTLFNTALNLPQIVQLEQATIVDQLEGNFAQSGVDAAQADLIVFSGVQFTN